MSVKENNWPESIEGHVIEDPTDLADAEIDYSQNVLGDLWLERGSFALVVGLSSVGKSTMVVQVGVEAALGRETFGLKVDRPCNVLVYQNEDSKNTRKKQTRFINSLARSEDERILMRAMVSDHMRILSPVQKALRGRNCSISYLKSSRTSTLTFSF
jgi:hypothetical protein